jgi:hypothetical protein
MTSTNNHGDEASDDSSSASSSASDQYVLNFDIFSRNSLAAKSDRNEDNDNDDEEAKGNAVDLPVAPNHLRNKEEEPTKTTMALSATCDGSDNAKAAIEEKGQSQRM